MEVFHRTPTRSERLEGPRLQLPTEEMRDRTSDAFDEHPPKVGQPTQMPENSRPRRGLATGPHSTYTFPRETGTNTVVF
jgi:hypothetical protein